jgi:hypothetical protein
MVRIHFPPAKSQANYGTAEATWARGQAVDLVDDHDVDRAGLGRRNLRGSLRFLSPFNCGETPLAAGWLLQLTGLDRHSRDSGDSWGQDLAFERLEQRQIALAVRAKGDGSQRLTAVIPKAAPQADRGHLHDRKHGDLPDR